ncbi:MAG: hypothetical protein K0S37_2928, partial [Microbacterium sp.]|nr:hypothetical protein [Microbacterium sp.]
MGTDERTTQWQIAVFEASDSA